jgi:hypothetical protein
MNRCLSDRSLFFVSEGEGDELEHAHLSGCRSCAARLDHIVHASELAGLVLREYPLAGSSLRPIGARPWWIPVAAAAAAVVAIVLVWRHGPPESPTLVPPGEARRELASLSLDRVSRLLFAMDAEASPAPDSDGTYLEAALGGEWPCEEQEPLVDPRCYY